MSDAPVRLDALQCLRDTSCRLGEGHEGDCWPERYKPAPRVPSAASSPPATATTDWREKILGEDGLLSDVKMAVAADGFSEVEVRDRWSALTTGLNAAFDALTSRAAPPSHSEDALTPDEAAYLYRAQLEVPETEEAFQVAKSAVTKLDNIRKRSGHGASSGKAATQTVTPAPESTGTTGGSAL